VPTLLGIATRDHHDMTESGRDLAEAPGTPVCLQRLVRLHRAHLHGAALELLDLLHPLAT
jgi:hypothetical protein